MRIDAILFENSIKPGGSRFAVLNNLIELSFISKGELRIFEVLLAIFNLSLQSGRDCNELICRKNHFSGIRHTHTSSLYDEVIIQQNGGISHGQRKTDPKAPKPVGKSVQVCFDTLHQKKKVERGV